jgi:hypothetical protein
VYGTFDELAKAERSTQSYVSRVLRLTLLAPDMVEAILDGSRPAELKLDDLVERFPLEWKAQRASTSRRLVAATSLSHARMFGTGSRLDPTISWAVR